MDILEVFGGHYEVSMRAYKKGWMTSQPFDILAGCERANAICTSHWLQERMWNIAQEFYDNHRYHQQALYE